MKWFWTAAVVAAACILAYPGDRYAAETANTLKEAVGADGAETLSELRAEIEKLKAARAESAAEPAPAADDELRVYEDAADRVTTILEAIAGGKMEEGEVQEVIDAYVLVHERVTERQNEQIAERNKTLSADQQMSTITVQCTSQDPYMKQASYVLAVMRGNSLIVMRDAFTIRLNESKLRK